MWSNTKENNLKRLQVAQNKAARIVLQCPYRTRVSTMNSQLAWLSVKCRLHYSLVCFIKTIIITKTPEVLYNKLDFFSDRHHYATRQSSEGRFLLPQCKTSLKQRTVNYRALVSWNSLHSFLISESNTTCFINKKLRLYLFTQEIV